jgi:hypothetical protein
MAVYADMGKYLKISDENVPHGECRAGKRKAGDVRTGHGTCNRTWVQLYRFAREC